MRVKRHRRRGAIYLGLAGLLVPLVVPAGATAATVTISGASLSFVAGSGEKNELRVDVIGPVFEVIDNAAAVTAGAGCTQRSNHRVTCPKAGVTLVDVAAGDNDDSVTTPIGSVAANLDGGSGIDSLTSAGGNDTLAAGRPGTGSGSETLISGGGEDTLHGPTSSGAQSSIQAGAGNDTLLGGPGFDSLFGDTGADVLSGGDGFDLTSWGDTAPVNVTVGSNANDGAPGEGDDVKADIELVFGTSFGDSLIGAGNSQQIFGGGGPDTLEGGSGDDFLDGGPGVDVLRGDAGADALGGGNDADDFSGGPGTDVAQFGDHSGPVTVTIDGNANDGGPGEGDRVRRDVENLEGGSDADTLIGNGQDNLLQGGQGADDLRGVGGEDTLFGDFTFPSGTSGNDQLIGGAGDDGLFGGDGADNHVGGPDFDFADYSRHAGSSNLTVTIDNTPNDGAAGEGDNVRDTVEGVIGANGNDTLTGSPGVNTLFGGGGTDDLRGEAGNDLLDGETPGSFTGFAADVFNGGPGSDTASYGSHSFQSVTVDIDNVADDGAFGGLEGDNVRSTVENLIGSDGSDTLTGNGAANGIVGANGNDTLFGGFGPDYLAGSGGFDTHEGQSGDDEINSRDGAGDIDNCGTGIDQVYADASDTVNGDCE